MLQAAGTAHRAESILSWWGGERLYDDKACLGSNRQGMLAGSHASAAGRMQRSRQALQGVRIQSSNASGSQRGLCDRAGLGVLG
jgi:hypothetical protein